MTRVFPVWACATGASVPTASASANPRDAKRLTECFLLIAEWHPAWAKTVKAARDRIARAANREPATLPVSASPSPRRTVILPPEAVAAEFWHSPDEPVKPGSFL